MPEIRQPKDHLTQNGGRLLLQCLEFENDLISCFNKLMALPCILNFLRSHYILNHRKLS